VVYPPTGSTAYERETSIPTTLLRSMALLLQSDRVYNVHFTVVNLLAVLYISNDLLLISTDNSMVALAGHGYAEVSK